MAKLTYWQQKVRIQQHDPAAQVGEPDLPVTGVEPPRTVQPEARARRRGADLGMRPAPQQAAPTPAMQATAGRGVGVFPEGSPFCAIGGMFELPISVARDQLGELVSKVEHAHERAVLTRHGRPVAAVVPIDDLRRL